jgi:hypothetical protein
MLVYNLNVVWSCTCVYTNSGKCLNMIITYHRLCLLTSLWFSLAIVNATKRINTKEDSDRLTITGDFQNFSSYIQPDVSTIVKPTLEEYALSLSQHNGYVISQSQKDLMNNLGVALLLPLTINAEYEEEKFTVPFQTNRCLATHVGPLSIMLSSEDLLFVSLLLRKVSNRSAKPEVAKDEDYEIEFTSAKLGLGLRKEAGQIIVDATQDGRINIGDRVFSVNGKCVSVYGSMTLAEFVDVLKKESRPLKIKFIRSLAGKALANASMDHDRSASSQRQIRFDKVDISLDKASITLIYNDTPVTRGHITTSMIHVKRYRAERQKMSLSVSTAITLDYFNRRAWDWEPLLEQSFLSLVTDYAETDIGPAEVTVELGDRSSGPFLINLSDAMISSVAALRDWKNMLKEADAKYDGALGTFYTDDFKQDARNAANAALQFARRQQRDRARPFVLKNKCGLSCAFVLDPISALIPSTKDWNVGVGDYGGLSDYSDDSIKVVPANEELDFSVERLKNPKGDRSDVFPTLTIAMQDLSGMELQPIQNLQIIRQGREVVPLNFGRQLSADHTQNGTVWVTWEVMSSNESTELSISSNVKLVSQLSMSIEVGVYFDFPPGSNIQSIGHVDPSEDFFVPLWILLRPLYTLYVRPSGTTYQFSQMITIQNEKCTTGSGIQMIEVRPVLKQEVGLFLAADIKEQDNSTCITLDCGLAIRNLLPASVGWQIKSVNHGPESILDGSTERNTLLDSGSVAESLVFPQDMLFLRFHLGQWSPWLSISLRDNTLANRAVELKDLFDYPTILGVRMSNRLVGLTVTLFADIWMLNSTSVPLCFGMSRQSLIRSPPQQGMPEISTAEAAFNELSLLFDSGNDTSDNNNDMTPIAWQAGTNITDSIFEYIEVKYSTVKRRWWGCENPLLTLSNIKEVSTDGAEGADWVWSDPEWVSSCHQNRYRVVQSRRHDKRCMLSWNDMIASTKPILLLTLLFLLLSESRHERCNIGRLGIRI